MANQRWATAEDRFGRNLRRLREKAGLSQAELAQKLKDYGVVLHPSAIAKIEARDVSNPRTIRLNEADALARALGVHFATLLSGPFVEFLEAEDFLNSAVINRQSAKQEEIAARNKLRNLRNMRQEVEDATSADEEAEITRAQARIDKLLKKLEELNGEHHEEA